MNIETTIIIRSKGYYLVEDFEDILIKVRKKHVKKIMDRVKGVEKKQLIILLAIIKKSRIILANSSCIANEKINKELANIAMVQLLNSYPIETLITFFEDIKYFQIKEILESDFPVEQFKKYL